jgi:hypothetical protein
LELIVSSYLKQSNISLIIDKNIFNNEITPEVENIISNFKNIISPEDIKLLKNKINGLNQTSFQRRLVSLIKELELNLDEEYIDSIKIAVRIRNHLLHGSSKAYSKGRVMDHVFVLKDLIIRIILSYLNYKGNYKSFYKEIHDEYVDYSIKKSENPSENLNDDPIIY